MLLPWLGSGGGCCLGLGRRHVTTLGGRVTTLCLMLLPCALMILPCALMLLPCALMLLPCALMLLPCALMPPLLGSGRRRLPLGSGGGTSQPLAGVLMPYALALCPNTSALCPNAPALCPNAALLAYPNVVLGLFPAVPAALHRRDGFLSSQATQ